MATLPLKYVQKCVDALRYVDDYEVKSSRVYVRWDVDEYEDGEYEPYVKIYHYGTLIAKIYVYSTTVRIDGAISKSDVDIINSFIILYGMENLYKARKTKDGVYLDIL